MKGIIKIDYPESLADALKLSGENFKSEMKTLTIIKLYEMGKISSGMAAKVLGLTRVDFIELLGKYNVSMIGADNLEDSSTHIKNRIQHK